MVLFGTAFLNADMAGPVHIVFVGAVSRCRHDGNSGEDASSFQRVETLLTEDSVGLKEVKDRFLCPEVLLASPSVVAASVNCH